MEFKEQIAADFDAVFFNSNEFAETHTINGVDVDIVVDNDRLAELYISKNTHTEELFTDSILFDVRKKDLDFEPVPNQYLEYDGEGYIISDVKCDEESYTIVIGVKGT